MGSIYYRYLSTRHQQKALSRLARNVKQNAIVLYAAPAFHTAEEFWNAVSQRAIVQRSNFAEAVKLDGHNRYTYVKAGNAGIGHSEAKRFRNRSLRNLLDSLPDMKPPTSSNFDFLKQMALAADEVMRASDRFSRLYAEIVNERTALTEGYPAVSSLLKAMHTVS